MSSLDSLAEVSMIKQEFAAADQAIIDSVRIQLALRSWSMQYPQPLVFAPNLRPAGEQLLPLSGITQAESQVECKPTKLIPRTRKHFSVNERNNVYQVLPSSQFAKSFAFFYTTFFDRWWRMRRSLKGLISKVRSGTRMDSGIE